MQVETALGQVTSIARFPVTSLMGEDLDATQVDTRGLVGDRLWAVRDVDDKLSSGKSIRRFRRMPGLLELAAGDGRDLTPVATYPDGWRLARTLSVRVRESMIRCVMANLPQARLAADGHPLDTLGPVNDTKLGFAVDVAEPGVLRLHDTLRVLGRSPWR